MGREVRRVPADWEHPKNDEDGSGYKPLLEGPFSRRLAAWNQGKAKWGEGLRENFEGTWVPVEEKHKHMSFEEWDGKQPQKEDYMPEWPVEVCTHYQMYETCTEGTPISPVMPTPEDLARWLVDNKANAFAGSNATYEQWLRVCKGGFAPSAAIINGTIISGVEALTRGE